MSKSSDNHRKTYVDYSAGMSKTCLIHGPGNSSDECKILGDFGCKYVKSIPTKDRGHDTVPGNKFNRQKEHNSIFNSKADEILLHENQKVSAQKEAPEHINLNFDENGIYQIDNTSIEETKEKLERHKGAFECELKSTYVIENRNDMICVHDNEVNNIAD